MSYSFEKHIHVDITEYDKVIRQFIPEYEQMQRMIARWCKAIVGPSPLVIDLGGGTGSLSGVIAEHFPDARIQLWDIDPKMMEIGKVRLQKYGDRIQFIEKSFEEPLPQCDAIVACIALHHIRDITKKTAVYANIYRALRSPGILANGDATMSLNERSARETYRMWTEFMMRHGITESEAQQHFANWREEDHYFSLTEEFEALKNAGFPHPEVFWKYGPMTVYGGVK
ncbi:MAG TPA: class I SAM-dependent methyltransferase [Bacteroidota bacterium]|nr:class I SAM-dependent methyltransferase [Bacteroidota bacterium]